MTVHKLAIADASFERSPGQDGEVFAGNLIDQRDGGADNYRLWPLRAQPEHR